MDLIDLPIRSNGQNVLTDASWWNDIRLVLLGLFGSGTTGNTQQNLSNNATAEVTGLLKSSSSYISFLVEYCAIRGTGRQRGKLQCLYTDGAWDISHEAIGDVGLTFSINSSTGQVSYTTTDDVTGKLQWKVTQTFGVEA